MGVRIWVELVISLAVGLTAILANVNMVGFVMNVQVPYLVPTTVDGYSVISTVGGGSVDSLVSSSPLLNNLLLLVGFGLQHSGMVRGPLQHMLRLVLSKENSRIFFVAITCAYLRLVFCYWAPMTYTLWNVQQLQLQILIYGFSGLVWLGVAVSLMTLDGWGILGIRGHLDKALSREKAESHFVTTGVYSLVRHPSYAFLMLAFFVTPTMSIGHLLFAVVCSVYILLAVVYLEEPDLVKAIGPRYEDYMRTTPRYIPNFTPVAAAKKS